MPAEAMTWAISPPMVPAPTTAALKTNIARRLTLACRRMSRRQLLERGLHVAVLWALAVAQPLFDLLGRNPEFFATRGSPPGDIVAFALLVTFAVPLLLIGLEWLAGLVERGAGLGAAPGLRGGAGRRRSRSRRSSWPGRCPPSRLALALGALAALAYVRWPAARAFLTVLGPAPLVFLALFLLVSDVSDLVFPGSADVQAAHVRATAPVVLVIFDEFPVHSLMAADGRVDAGATRTSPGWRGDATWYRDTASVDQDTPYAVPAILDGRLPRQDRLPVAADHPQNIFSLLGDRYELHVREDATALCAPSLCQDADRPGFRDRMRSLWDDLSLVYAHEVLPDDVERELPSVSETWGDFNGGLDTGAAVADTGSPGARPSASASCASTPTSPRAARGASRSSWTASRAGGGRACT